ncbi:MAG: S8 family serine peptidase, partial [bacterium]|nr:S8 family serine peptidase [bacterium]
MSTYFFSLTRRPFSSPRDPGFLRSMAPTIVESQKRYRRDTLRSFQRGSILALVALVVFASSYPTAFVTAATENATSRASVPLREWGMKDGSSYVQGEVVVKFREGNIDLGEARGVRDARTFAARKRLVVKEMIEGENVGVLKTQDAESVPETIARLEQDPEVAAVQPNFQYRSRTIGTDDTYRDQLWGLDNTGQNVDGASGTADADIDAPEAWAISEGSSDIIAAVIDTGVAYNHPDLLPNMWDGTECKDENGDPLGGCNHGYDYEDGDLTPLPMWSEHGTHISGTIAAVKNNGKGIIGVAPHTKIMALKSGLSTSDNVKSINFAKQNGAKVINASWGMSSNTCDDVFDPLLYQAIQDFPGLFIAASGNSSEEHNGTTYVDMPSDYGHTTSCWTGLPNVINVAAVNSNDNRAVFSDYG